MRLREILTFGGGRKDTYPAGAEIRRIAGTGGGERTVVDMSSGSAKSSITLVPMKSLSLDRFSFPFQNAAKISDALRLQSAPYMAEGGVYIFPSVISRHGRASDGVAWYVSHNELDIPAPKGGVIWPAPLVLVSGLSDFGGNGVSIWTDEQNICSLLWQSNRPVMYRWRKKSSSEAVGREVSFFDGYCASQSLERGGTFVYNACESAGDISGLLSESVKICPWFGGVNLSRKVLEGARDLARTVEALTRGAVWLIVLGVIVIIAEGLLWHQADETARGLRARTEDVYRRTFEPGRNGRISNAVRLARDKIASLSGGRSEARSLAEVLSAMAEVYSASQGITIDIIRYNADGFDCTGVAEDMTSALNFRKAWEARADNVQADGAQFVSGIGYRFDLRVRW